jgi:hypothetical protein
MGLFLRCLGENFVEGYGFTFPAFTFIGGFHESE